MYLERDGRLYLPVKEETYNDLWLAINDKPLDPVGFHLLHIGDVTLVIDSPEFRKWVCVRTETL